MPPLEVGLTGGIGSGKSTVAALFAEHGAAVIDADALAHEATRDPEVLRAIAGAFGEAFVENGALDRAALAAIVFGNPEARTKLNAIIHPYVARARAHRVAQLVRREPPPQVILHDIPLLFEVGLAMSVDKTVVVAAPLELRVARVMARSGLTAEAVRDRDAAQWPLGEKVARADFVIDNSGGLASLTKQVARVWAQLLASRRVRP